MNNEGNIGLYEAVSLASMMLLAKIFYTNLGAIVNKTGTAAWYVSLISCSVTLVVFYFYYLLMKRFEGQNIIQIYETVLGKFLGKTLSIFYCGFGIYYSGIRTREFIEMLKAYTLPYSSTSILMGIVVLASGLFCYLGLETIARVSSTALIPVIAGLGIILILVSPHYETGYLKPFMGHGIKNILSNGLLQSSTYFEFFILMLLINSIHGLKVFKKAGFISILLTGAIFSITTFCYLMIFGYNSGGENLSGLFELSKTIYFNRYIERLESIFLFIWVVSAVINISIAFYMVISIYSKVFEIKNYKPIIYPFSVVMLMIAMLPENLVEVTQIHITFISEYTVFLIYPLPFILLLISIVLKKKGRPVNVQNR